MIAKYALVLLLFVPVLQQKTITGKVIHVIDGDTIEILYDGKPLRIRLNGIDCPEKGQSFGTAAKQEVARLCAGLIVAVISHGKDRYGRTLGDVVLPDSTILNQWLVQKGLAWHYKHYSNDEVLTKLEASAVKGKIGLWVEEKPVPPWEYRHSRTSTKQRK